MIGLKADSQIEYGISSDDQSALGARLQSFVAEFGEAKVTKTLGISAAKLRLLAAGTQSAGADRLTAAVAARLPAAIQLCAKTRHDRHLEIKQLRDVVTRYGVREAARRIGIDPSNLRRRLLTTRRR